MATEIPNIELVYFPIPARAQPIRLVFAIGGIPFTDTHVSFEEFGKLAASGELPLQTLPILKVNGKIVSSQSGAMIRFAASLSGLSLQGASDVMRGEDVAGTVNDVVELLGKLFDATADEKPQRLKELIESGFPFYARRIETILNEGTHSSPFINEAISFPDVLAFCLCSAISETAKSGGFEDPVAKFPRLQKLAAAVGELPAVKNYPNL